MIPLIEWSESEVTQLCLTLCDLIKGGFPGGSLVKNPPANAGDTVWSLCWEDPLEKKMATHSGTLAWEIPWTEEPGGLQSMGSQRFGHDCNNWAWSKSYRCASLMAQMVKNLPAIREMWVQSLGWEDPLKKKWLPTPVFWPREFHGLKCPWGGKE